MNEELAEQTPNHKTSPWGAKRLPRGMFDPGGITRADTLARDGRGIGIGSLESVSRIAAEEA